MEYRVYLNNDVPWLLIWEYPSKFPFYVEVPNIVFWTLYKKACLFMTYHQIINKKNWYAHLYTYVYTEYRW